MKKRYYLAIQMGICLIVILSVSGCWSRHELNTLAIVIGMGLDQAEKEGEVQATAQIFKPGEGGKSTAKNQQGGGSDSQSYWNVKNTGASLYEVIQGFAHQSNQKLYFADNQVLIFSSEIAKEGVQKYIDFFVRNHETRMNVWVLVAKNRADEVLSVPSELEKTSAMYISQLVEAQTQTSEACQVNLEQFITRLMSKTDAAIAPLIEVKNEEKAQTLSVAGTAIFKSDQLVGQLNGRETRGLLWVIDEIKNGVINVDSPGEEGKVSLEITRSQSKVTPEIIDGNIHMKIKIKEEGNIAFQSNRENLTKIPTVEYLEKEQEKAIENEITAALEIAKDLNADIFAFGDLLHQKYPTEWQELKDRWEEVFPQIEVEFDIQAKLRRTGRISSPVTPPELEP